MGQAAARSSRIVGALSSEGNNLIENVGGCSISGSLDNIVGQDPGLTALASNGGLTQTHAFPAAAPPHNAGNSISALGLAT